MALSESHCYVETGVSGLSPRCLLLSSESSSGDHELRLPPPLHPQQDLNPRHHEDTRPYHHLHHRHRQHRTRSAKLMPAALLDPRFRQEPGGQQTVNLLTRPHHDVRPEHTMVSARHLVTVVSTLSSSAVFSNGPFLNLIIGRSVLLQSCSRRCDVFEGCVRVRKISSASVETFKCLMSDSAP